MKESAVLTSKGRLVIPLAIRKRLNLAQGAKFTVHEEKGRIVLQPITRELIFSFAGILKRKTGGKSVTHKLAEDRARDSN